MSSAMSGGLAESRPGYILISLFRCKGSAVLSAGHCGMSVTPEEGPQRQQGMFTLALGRTAFSHRLRCSLQTLTRGRKRLPGQVLCADPPCPSRSGISLPTAGRQCSTWQTGGRSLGTWPSCSPSAGSELCLQVWFQAPWHENAFLVKNKRFLGPSPGLM